MPECSLANPHIFSINHSAAFLCSGTLDSTWALCVGNMWNSEITKEKPPDVKIMALKRWWKRHPFTAWEVNQEGGATLFSLSWVTDFSPLRTCLQVTDYKSTVSTDFGVTKRFWWGVQFTSSERASDEDGLCLVPPHRTHGASVSFHGVDKVRD